MKTFAKEVLRWGAIAATGGLGVWLLVEIARSVAACHVGDALGFILLLFTIFLHVLIAVPCLAAAYFCLRRQYRKVFLALGPLGSVGIFLALWILPSHFGLFKLFEPPNHEDSVLALLGIPILFFQFVAPVYGAMWFSTSCCHWAYPELKRPKTRATRWLLGLGALCLIVPALILLVQVVNCWIHHQPLAPAAEPLHTTLRWTAGMAAIGSLLIFCGLVRRQPVVEEQKRGDSHVGCVLARTRIISHGRREKA
jgi:hypothetical protein